MGRGGSTTNLLSYFVEKKPPKPKKEEEGRRKGEFLCFYLLKAARYLRAHLADAPWIFREYFWAYIPALAWAVR